MLANTHTNSEALLRSAISRAYYAAFHHAKYYLQTRIYRNHKFPNKDIHEFVITEFSTVDKAHFKVSEKLRILRDTRNKADYEAGYNINSANSQYILELAQKVIIDVDSF